MPNRTTSVIVLLTASSLFYCSPALANAPSYWFKESIVEGQTKEERDLRKWVGGCMSRIEIQLRKSVIRRRVRPGTVSFHNSYCDNPFSKTVSCRVRVLNDGSISDLEIVSSSGVLQADLLAYSVIRRSAPFDAPPNKLAFDRGVAVSFIESDAGHPPPLEVGLYKEPLGPARRFSKPGASVPEADLSATDCIRLAEKYAVMQQQQTAHRFLEKALVCISKEHSSPKREGQLYVMMGEIYDLSGNPYEALNLYRRAARVDPERNSKDCSPSYADGPIAVAWPSRLESRNSGLLYAISKNTAEIASFRQCLPQRQCF